MSDFSVAIKEGHGDPAAVIAALWNKELGRVNTFIAAAPPDLQPALQGLKAGATTVLQDAVAWGGTALASYVTSNSDTLKGEVVKLVSGVMGKTDPTSPAAADALQAVTSLILGIVQHEALAAFGVTIPQPQPLSGAA